MFLPDEEEMLGEQAERRRRKAERARGEGEESKELFLILRSINLYCSLFLDSMPSTVIGTSEKNDNR